MKFNSKKREHKRKVKDHAEAKMIEEFLADPVRRAVVRRYVVQRYLERNGKI